MISSLVSIIIPIYNVEKYVKECLLSVFNQTYKNIELIIVDDRGADESMTIVNDMLKRCPFKFTVITQDKNYGVSEARNRGINQAAGEYIFFLDSDDLITSNCIEVLYNSMIEYGADLVISDHKIFYNYNKDEVLSNIIKNKNRKVQCFNVNYDEQNDYIWNVLYKKDLIIDNEIYFEKDIKFAEDALWITLVQFKAKKMIRIDAETYLYRITNQSSCISLCSKDKYVENLILVIEKLFDYIKSGKYSDREKGVIISRIRSYKNGIYSSIVLYKTRKEDISYDKLKKVKVSIKDIVNSDIPIKKKIIEFIFSLITILESYSFYKLIFKVRLLIKNEGM